MITIPRFILASSQYPPSYKNKSRMDIDQLVLVLPILDVKYCQCLDCNRLGTLSQTGKLVATRHRESMTFCQEEMKLWSEFPPFLPHLLPHYG